MVFEKLDDLKTLMDCQFVFRYDDTTLQQIVDQTELTQEIVTCFITLPVKCFPRRVELGFMSGNGWYATLIAPKNISYEGDNMELAKLCEGQPLRFKNWKDIKDFFLRMEVL